MVDPVHLIVTNEGDHGFSASSPQLPGFFYARPTLTEFNRDLPKVLADIDAPRPAAIYEQRRGVSPEGREYLIRIAVDESRGQRLDVAWRLDSMLGTEQRLDALSADADVTGEVVFVCCLPDDRLGSIAAQMSEPQDALVVVANVADQGVWTQQLSLDPERAQHPDSESLADLGLTMESTISEMMHADAVSGLRGRALVVT